MSLFKMELWILLSTLGLLLVSSVVLLITVMSRKKKDKEVCIIGLNGSGKTKLFYKICTKQTYSTITSMEKNEFQLAFGNKKVNLTDLPGHPRIRTEVISTIKNADALIFTVDSKTIFSQISDIANFLYDIFSLKEIYTRKIPILIASTKTDLEGSRSIEIIKSELEKEITDLRANRQQSNFVENDDNIYIGEEGIDFEFSQLPNDVQFGTTTTISDQISTVVDFIDKNT